MNELAGKIALVTGASRGIGAEVARLLAGRGADVVVNYRSKRARAEEVAGEIEAAGRRALVVRADLTAAGEMAAMYAAVAAQFGRLDLLILNASGGLEKDKGADYAMKLNVVGQMRAVDLALPLLVAGSTIIFVTSHLAHFYGEKPVYPGYEAVAESKQAGERALQARLGEFSSLGLRLLFVSGDLIEGTITPKLMQRQNPGLIAARKEQAGGLPTVAQFAEAIVAAAANPSLANGEFVFVGSTDWVVELWAHNSPAGGGVPLPHLVRQK